MKISVIGTGYVGLIQTVGMAKIGYKVTAIDIFEEKINKLKSGIPTIYEKGLDELLKDTLQNINFTTKISEIKGSDIIFLCVGTPQDDEGKTDLGYIFGACDDISPNLDGNEIIIIKSTVPVGVNKTVFELLGSKNPVVSNPEFLREGLAIEDFFNPDRIVLGFKEDEKNAVKDKVKKLFDFLKEKNVTIIETNWQTSELIKYSSNTFLATKISFINEIARFSDQVGANIKDLSKALGMDNRIGNKFLDAGIGYGGSCFPKDVKSLIHQFEEKGLKGKIIKKVDEINCTQVDYFSDKIFGYYDGKLHGKTLSILGVAFKPGTDDLRGSKGLELVKKLMYGGAKLKIFDYNSNALVNFKRYLDGLILSNSRGFFGVEVVSNFEELTQDTNCLIISLEDKSVLLENFEKVKLKDNIIFDGRNILDKDKIISLGIKYVGIGY